MWIWVEVMMLPCHVAQHTSGSCENLSAEFEVSFVRGWSTQAAEDDAEIIATWEELDRNLKWMVEIASHLKDRLVTSHFKLEGGLGGTGWEQTLIRLCITHCLYFDNIMIMYSIS